MGSRTTETLTEIDQIRARLEGTLRQLEGRMPPVAQIGKRALALSGGTVGGGLALAVLKKVVSRKGKRKASRAQAEAPVVSVKPAVSFPAALAVAAIWAGVRIYEAKQRANAGEQPKATLSVLPGKQRA